MEARHFRIVVVGHVDHGKSTLIGRLLHESGSLAEGQVDEIRRATSETDPEWAFLMDHLEEEREQERTIESAQAFFATPNRTYRIIDAPGHKEFLRNMVTGAAQADAAVLVVDVEAGVQEQTRRHAALLAMLGLRRLIVAINKMDCVGGRRDDWANVSEAARVFLDEIGLAADCVVPISAMKGWNLSAPPEELGWHEGPTLFAALDALAPPEPLSSRPLRLPVQDVYDRNGRTVLVGRVESGRITQGQSVTCLPSRRVVEVATVERFLEERTSAEAGESIGLTLTESLDVSRGVVLCDNESPAPVVQAFDANLFWLGDAGWADGDLLALRCATQQAPCRIESVVQRMDSSSLEVIETGASRLNPTEVARVIIRLERPLIVEQFSTQSPLGKFVLLKDGVLSAGGTVASFPDSDPETGAADA